MQKVERFRLVRGKILAAYIANESACGFHLAQISAQGCGEVGARGVGVLNPNDSAAHGSVAGDGKVYFL